MFSEFVENLKGFYVTTTKKELPYDPNNYRPISVSSCLGKLLERIINSRLYKFLEEINILAQEQSGFRRNRRTTDNIFFFIQKKPSLLIGIQKVCGLFFEISKAFDKVWHTGLLYKLIRLNIPNYGVVNFGTKKNN